MGAGNAFQQNEIFSTRNLHEHDPEIRRTSELLNQAINQAINQARDRGDIELLELIAHETPRRSFSTKAGPAPLRRWRGLAAGRITKREEDWMPRNAAKSELGLFFHVPLACAPGSSAPPSDDESVIDTIAAAQQEELEEEISGLIVEALEAEKEIEELVASSPF